MLMAYGLWLMAYGLWLLGMKMCKLCLAQIEQDKT